MGAVHVHLAVSNLVEPGPREDGVSSRRVVGQGEAPGGLEGALADPRVEGLPGSALVVGQGDLAAASLVGGRAGEGQVVSASGLPGDD